MKIEDVVIIIPCWNESLKMLQVLKDDLDKVGRELNRKGVSSLYYFIDDDAINLPDNYPVIVRHDKNEQLATTLLHGYQEVFKLKNKPDLIVRMDSQEHDPRKIIEIVDHMENADIGALFLPVWYWVKGEYRPPMKEISSLITRFVGALSPIDSDIVMDTFNQKFPLGYQAYKIDFLKKMLSLIEKAYFSFLEIHKKPATWGLDLISILIAADIDMERIDFLFGGYSTPWKENRGADKVKAQEDKAQAWMEVARAMGLPFKKN